MNNFLNNFRYKMMTFMQGRYGNDQLNRFLTWLSLALLIISIFTTGYLYTAAFVVLVCGYFRMFSKNISARYAENQKFLQLSAKFNNLEAVKSAKRFFVTMKLRFVHRKTHHIYVCPTCKQNIRIPKGKGRIQISCPRCHTQFTKVS